MFHVCSPAVVDRLSSYPFVTVRIRCDACGRAGAYRLARLAAKFGPECSLNVLLDKLAGDCPHRRPRHPYREQCAARFVDLAPPRRPPDEPHAGLKVIVGGRN